MPEAKTPGWTKEDLDPNTPYERKVEITKQRFESALQWKAISPHTCQYCGKAAAYEHPKNGYVCSSCPRYG